MSDPATSSRALTRARQVAGFQGWLWLVGGGLLFVLVALVYGYYVTFSHFLGDDEGYLMISVRGFLAGHPLYDSVFTQYGPLYYFYQWVWRGLFQLPLTHDATRWLCLAHWVAAALVLGAAGWSLTRSRLIGIFVFMQAIVHLRGITNEPGHPQELVALLLAAAALVSNRARSHPLPASALAILCAVLALIKINAGGFLGLALLLAVRAHASDRFARSGWTFLIGGLIALLPFALMRHHLSASWCRHYATVTAIAIASTFVIASYRAAKVSIGPGVYARMAGWFSGTWAVTLGLLLLTGTSLTGCLAGLLLTPLRMPGVALQPLLLPPMVMWTAGLSVLAAFAFVWMVPKPWTLGLAVALKGLYGLAGAILLVDAPLAQLGFLLPWAWLILLPPDLGEGSKPEAPFGRVFLCLAAVWQALQAYPIAGTQAAVGTVLLVLIYTTCLHDAWLTLAHTRAIRQWQVRVNPSTPPLLRGLTWAALLYLFAMIWCPPHLWRQTYAHLAPLALPGAEAVRMEPEGAQLYQQMTEYLRRECDTFVTYPGVNSLYFWTGKRPPTQLNSTGWGQLTPAQQAQILHALTQAQRPLLVVHQYVSQGWQDPKRPPTPIDTLIAFVTHRCKEVARIGPYIIYRPQPALILP